MGPSALELSVKYIGVMLCACVIFLVGMKDRCSVREKAAAWMSSALIGLVTGMLYNVLPVIDILLMMTLYYFAMHMIFRQKADRVLSPVLISLMISYILYLLSFGITVFLLFLNKTAVSYRFDRSIDAWIYIVRKVTVYRKGAFFARCFVFALQYVLMTITLRIRKVKNELKGLTLVSRNDSLVFFWVSVFLFKILMETSVFQRKDASAVVIPCVFLIVLLILICYFWMKKELKVLYEYRLQDNLLGILEKSLAYKAGLLETLRADNERISEIIHKDNKLIPSMVMTVEKAAEAQGNGEDASLAESVLATAHSLDEIYAARLDALEEYESHVKKMIRTGVTDVDAALLFLRGRAEEAGVEFKAELHADLPQKLSGTVAISEFIVILADLCEYAVQSAGNAGASQMAVEIGQEEGRLYMQVFDNGSAFNLNALRKTYVNLPQKNGSGEEKNVRLIPLFRILKHSGASLTVNEIPDNSQFTKSLRVTLA